MSETDAAVAAPAATTTNFPSFLYAHGGWFPAFGLQMVLFPYLVRVILRENEIRFGLAQMSMQLPTALLILVGGFMADRIDALKVVIIGCSVAPAGLHRDVAFASIAQFGG